jgi:pyruvate dehydrogenase E2 component (dihydrolipoamide acetyltransferase)
MPREFLLPELAESVVEGEIMKWLVAEGERVSEDQPIVEVMTDKVTVELPSPYNAVLEKRLVAEGDIVPVQAPIALFSDGERADEVAASGDPLADEDDGDALTLFSASKETDDGPTVQVRRPDTAAAFPSRATGPYGRVLAVPAARKLARELGIDIERVQGSGPNGRIRIDDVRAHSESPVAAVGVEREERIPLRGLRRAISKQMVASHLQAVRTLHVDEADVTALVAVREKLKPMAEREGVRLSYLPFIMKAVVSALKAFPMINASLDDEADEIVRKYHYHLGMAVATDVGLVVPVIHHADSKSILELADEIQVKAERARSGKLLPDDVRGGTFTVTNIGNLGGLFSFPIINVPEAAILGVHTIKKRPVVLDDDSIVARQMLYLSMSFDHRVIDGAESAMFTGRVIELLETPEALMLEL